MKPLRSYAVIFTCGVLWFSLLVGCGSAPDLSALFPIQVGEADRTELLTGKEALRAVDKLHGKHISAEDAAVATYGHGHPPDAQVWLSRATNAAAAREQLAVMLNRMIGGKAPFSAPLRELRAGVELYRTEGLGMVHLIWSSNDLIWWVAVLPGLEDAYLDVFLVDEGAVK